MDLLLDVARQRRRPCRDRQRSRRRPARVRRSRSPTARGGGSAATRSAGCSPTTCWPTRAATTASWSRPSCRRRCCARWRPPTTCTRPRPSPGSSGSPGRCSTIRSGDFVMGYEQALGYLVADRPLDKDGISAAVLFAEIAAAAHADGRTLQGWLDDIAARFGRHRLADASIRMTPAEAAAKVRAMRADPPSEIGGRSRAQHRGVSRGRPAAVRARGRRAGPDPPERHRAQGQALRRSSRRRPRPLRRRRWATCCRRLAASTRLSDVQHRVRSNEHEPRVRPDLLVLVGGVEQLVGDVRRVRSATIRLTSTSGGIGR